MKKEHQGIRAAIDLYHQIQKEASETSWCHESGAAIKQLLSYYWKSVHSGFCAVCLENHKPMRKNTRCLLHLLTRNMQGTLKPDLNIKVIFWITNWVIVSIRGFIILQPKTVVADRGTDMCDPKRFWRVLKSDFNIMLRCEKHNKGVKNANTQFNKQLTNTRNKDILWIPLSFSFVHLAFLNLYAKNLQIHGTTVIKMILYFLVQAYPKSKGRWWSEFGDKS